MKKNQMILLGQDVKNLKASLAINLADDYADVSGFGQPITKELAKKMCDDYCNDYDSVQSLLTDLEDNTIASTEALTSDKRFAILQNMLSPDKHIISGVFGKELLLQILAQKTCEGIRYILGKDQEGKTTVVLLGVKETPDDRSEPYDQNEKIMIRCSEPVSAPIGTTPFQPTDPIIGEVHKSGKTVSQIQSTVDKAEKDGLFNTGDNALPDAAKNIKAAKVATVKDAHGLKMAMPPAKHAAAKKAAAPVKKITKADVLFSAY